MTIRVSLSGLFVALGLFFLAAPTLAAAQCCVPTPPCNCTPPTPPVPPCNCTPPTPPTTPCCQSTNHTNINVNVSNVSVAIANAASSAQAGAGAGAGAGAAVYYGGGGGGGGYVPPMGTGLIQGLNVEQGRRVKRVSYEATRTVTKRVAIQAVCLDDRTIPHPASQVSPDRNVEDAFEGEIYRCIAGTWLQATIAEFHGREDFSGGQTITCRKMEALFHARGGKVECRAQIPARDCNERSLLRRFGAGIKVLTMVTTERYTAWREETEKVETSVATTMSLDGGVGGTVY
jgi:hypothetical protein